MPTKNQQQKTKTKFELGKGQRFVTVGRDGITVTVGVQRSGPPAGHPKPPACTKSRGGGTGSRNKSLKMKRRLRQRRFKERERRKQELLMAQRQERREMRRLESEMPDNTHSEVDELDGLLEAFALLEEING